MFNWILFIYLVLVCIPGMLIAVRGALKTISKLVEDKLPPGKEMPPMSVILVASTIQSLILIAVPAAIGTAVAHRVDLHAPFFEALVVGGPLWNTIEPQVFPSLAVGIGGALIFVAAYYMFFRPRLDEQTVSSMEELRNGIGIWGRVMYGGIAEEVITRWGLMSLLVWLGVLLAGSPNPAVVWAAIVISGLLFGLGHLPGYLASGCKRTPLFLGAMISLNLWASLIFGWLFWQVGLLAAMVAHMLFHLVWLPFDLYFYKPAERDLVT